MKAINIKWDTDGDLELLKSLPTEMDIPEYLIDENTDIDGYEEDISDWLSNQVGFCHFGFDLVNELSKKYIDILNGNDWSILSYIGDGRVELEKYSPLGEDFIMYVDVINFPDSVRKYADDYDVDEHVAMWIDARRNEVPESVKELVENAYAIKQMLYELADALERNGKPNI